MTQAEIEKTLDQLVRRARCDDAIKEWAYESPHNWKGWCDKIPELRTAHGVVPFEEPKREGLKYGAEIRCMSDGLYGAVFGKHYLGRYSDEKANRWEKGEVGFKYGGWDTYSAALSALNAAPEPPGYTAPPAPQPASEGVRYFTDKKTQSVFCRIRFVGERGTWMDGPQCSQPLGWFLTSDAYIETDSNWKPLAKPATENAMENRAMAFVAANMNMCASGMLTNFARREIARATASLRAEVEVQRIMANGNFDGWQKVEKERDELRAEVERLKKKPARRPARGKGRG